MSLSADLTPDALAAALPGRAVRSYVALVSTGSAAHGWATEGAPDGAVVIADHQLSPRGHAGRPLTDAPGQGVGLSVIMRPALPAAREGWLYTVVLTALADAFGDRSTVEWPDEVHLDGEMVAAVGVHTSVDEVGGAIRWAIVDVLLPEALPPRGAFLRAVLEAIDARAASPAEAVIADYDRACRTIGRQVSARLRAGTGPRLEGRALETIADGAMVLETAKGLRAPVRPHDVPPLGAGVALMSSSRPRTDSSAPPRSPRPPARSPRRRPPAVPRSPPPAPRACARAR